MNKSYKISLASRGKWIHEFSPLIIDGDFECAVIHSSDNIDFGRKTEKCQDHIVCSYSYKLICVDDWYSNWYKIYLVNAFGKCSNDIIKE